ncbi:CPBP family intramembrane metalloprotease [Janthinobacterium sp. SUN118]|uniref:CPBP family intramembrane glutamic endopeptidase n=1 Tax=Janthinobacterium sp. SUN118 TaxID=3004100 RepID=UPI0025AEDB65|nr:CPBP family intramembrane glutamic endopeptidase [Janthinobacterium sp. SUN118]MDN2712199.1 CPBP family intramembrane metalloprotease [Janthinobacterium sp. SUN118]
MPEITSLAQYLLAITPAFLVCAALLLATQGTVLLLRVLVHILFFVLARDAMTAHGYWQVAAGGLRFTAPPLVLLVLAAMSLGLVASTCWLESEARRQISWMGRRPLLSVLLGAAGAMLIVGLAMVLKTLAGLPSLAPVAPSMLPLLLGFALAANWYEELLFRGLLQQQLRAWLPAWRAALVSGLLFGLCHAFLATTVTQVGAPILVFTVIEGVVAGLVYCRAGLLGASLAHGLAIFALAAGWV